MKTKLLYAAAAVMIAALLAVAGCSNPLTGDREAGLSDEGLVVLRFSDVRAMTIVPEISLDIHYYEVSFTRQGFQPVHLTGIGGDATETEAVRLLPGPWQVIVSAFNDEDILIGLAVANITVVARQSQTVPMAIQSLVGEGTLLLTADLSDLELLEPTISGMLISGASGDQTEISMPVNGTSASFEQELEAGTYLLTLELAEDGTPIASYVNTVLIVFEQTTSAALVFRPAAGSVVVELLDQITRPIAITLDGLQDTIGTDESMTVTAVTATEVDSYQWYLDGEEVDGEVNESITLGPGLAVGEYLLTVVVQRGAVYSAQAGEFTVVAEPVPVQLTMASVPGGIFQRDEIETNITGVSAFSMSVYPITRAQFLHVMDHDPSDETRSTGTDDPVQMVNWYHAIAFCNKLSLAEGKELVYSVAGITDWGALPFDDIPITPNNDWNEATMNMDADGYRLPTEAEWMWAAMGATLDARDGAFDGAGINRTGYTKGYAGSREDGSSVASIGEYAVYSENSGPDDTNEEPRTTRPVGSKLPNELGLYDMSGNVWEWTWDWVADYPSGVRVDYAGPDSGAARVLRGGRWNGSASLCAVALRDSRGPFGRNDFYGFRVVSR